MPNGHPGEKRDLGSRDVPRRFNRSCLALIRSSKTRRLARRISLWNAQLEYNAIPTIHTPRPRWQIQRPLRTLVNFLYWTSELPLLFGVDRDVMNHPSDSFYTVSFVGGRTIYLSTYKRVFFQPSFQRHSETQNADFCVENDRGENGGSSEYVSLRVQYRIIIYSNDIGRCFELYAYTYVFTLPLSFKSIVLSLVKAQEVVRGYKCFIVEYLFTANCT